MAYEYDPRAHWSSVGQKIQHRAENSEVAGDDSPFFRYKRRRFVMDFLRRIPVTGRTVLEVGCGPGGNLAELAPQSPARLVGADIAPEMLDVAQVRLGSRADFALVAPGGRLPFADREFDVAFTATVLQHNPPASFSATLAELCRVTRHELWIFEDVGPEEQGNPTYYPRSVDTYAKLAAAQGFSAQGVRRLPVSVSSRVCLSLAARFGHSLHQEGAPLSRRQEILERSALVGTRVADRFVALPGLLLTEMRFARSA